MADKSAAGNDLGRARVAKSAGRQFVLDESKTISGYTNFCRVTGTPEELIVDCGLNAHQQSSSETTVQLNQRIIMNYYTAKRLLSALATAIRNHEEQFGELEIDVAKRAQKKNG